MDPPECVSAGLKRREYCAKVLLIIHKHKQNVHFRPCFIPLCDIFALKEPNDDELSLFFMMSIVVMSWKITKLAS